MDTLHQQDGVRTWHDRSEATVHAYETFRLAVSTDTKEMKIHQEEKEKEKEEEEGSKTGRRGMCTLHPPWWVLENDIQPVSDHRPYQI